MRAAVIGQPPVSRVIDIGRAVHDGRRRLRRRRAVAVAAGAVLAVAVPVGAAGVTTAVREAAYDPRPAASRTAAVSPTPVPATAPPRFDPLRLRLRAGWMPDGLPERRQRIEPTRQLVSHSEPGEEGRGKQLTIVIHAAGVPLEQTTFGHMVTGWNGPGPAQSPATAEPGPRIGGADREPATWYGESLLVWRWAPDAYAEVYASGFGSRDANRETAVHAAAEARTDRVEPVRMPLAAPAPPASLRLVGSLVWWDGAGGCEGQLVFSDRDDATDPETRIPRMLLVSVEKTTDTAGSDGIGYPTTTVDGHPAIVDFDDRAGRVVLFGVAGHRVTVYVYDPVTLGYVGRDRALALARAVRPTADERSWTTTPVG